MSRVTISILLLVVMAASAAALSPGDRGYGLTVLEGNEITRFQVTYIGRLERVMGGQDMHLVRLEGEPFERAGIIAGMSGSPIYFDGELLGALAYAWGFAKDPIAGVTPIEAMRSVMDAGGGSPATEGLDHSVSPEGFTPVATPIMVSGLDIPDRTLDGILPAGDFVRVPGGDAPGPTDLEPGGVIGAQLISGDLNMTAVGTVTMIEDGNVWAFGHAFLGRGMTSMPMTTGSILTIMPSFQQSFKLGAVGPTVGAVVRDRQAAIAGRLGTPPEMARLDVSYATPDGERDFSFDVIQDRLLTPALMTAAFTASMQTALGNYSPGIYSIELTIRLKGGEEVTITDRLASEVGPSEFTLMGPVELLYHNPFVNIRPDSVRVALEYDPDFDFTRIEGMILPVGSVEPGETITIGVDLENYDGTSERIGIPFQVPRNIEDGEYPVSVMPGRGGMVPGNPTPKDLETMLEAWERYERHDNLVVEMVVPGMGIAREGRALPNLPPSVRSRHGVSETIPLMERRYMRLELPAVGFAGGIMRVERR